MSLPRPNEPYHFQANLIWWDSPFKYVLREIYGFSEHLLNEAKFLLFVSEILPI
jgi:hypothetical protein